MKRSLWALVIAIPLVILLAFGFSHDPSSASSPLLNKPAPTFALHTLRGDDVSLVSLRGRPVLVNFWASWCLSCKAEHAALISAYRRYGSKGVTFLGIVFQDSSASARQFLLAHGGSWKSLVDPGGTTAVDYGVTGIPETFLIDRKGIIRYHFPGPVTLTVLDNELSRLESSA